MRSLLEFGHWAERHPAEALDDIERWFVPDGPARADFESGLAQQVERDLIATGSSEVLEVAIEASSDVDATVLVWMRSDAFEFVGPDETLASPAFDRTLFIFELHREPSGSWRIFDRRIALPA